MPNPHDVHNVTPRVFSVRAVISFLLKIRKSASLASPDKGAMPSYFQTSSLRLNPAFDNADYLYSKRNSGANPGLVEAVQQESAWGSGRFLNPMSSVPPHAQPQHFHVTGPQALYRDPYLPGVTDPTSQYLYHPHVYGYNRPFWPAINASWANPGCPHCLKAVAGGPYGMHGSGHGLFGLSSLETLLLVLLFMSLFGLFK